MHTYGTKKSKSIQNWRTPRWLFDYADDTWGAFELDAAASDDNALCARYNTATTSAADSLSTYATANSIWCNPPFAHVGKFVRELSNPAYRRVVMLVPANYTSGWYLDTRRHWSAYLLAPRINYVMPDKPHNRYMQPLPQRETPNAPGGASMFLVRHPKCSEGTLALLDLREISRG